jgi:hypothetical protein
MMNTFNNPNEQHTPVVQGMDDFVNWGQGVVWMGGLADNLPPISGLMNATPNVVWTRLDNFHYWFKAGFHEAMGQLPEMDVNYFAAAQWVIAEEIETLRLMQVENHNSRLSPYREIYDISKSFLNIDSYLRLINVDAPVVYGDVSLSVIVDGVFLTIKRNIK